MLVVTDTFKVFVSSFLLIVYHYLSLQAKFKYFLSEPFHDCHRQKFMHVVLHLNMYFLIPLPCAFHYLILIILDYLCETILFFEHFKDEGILE